MATIIFTKENVLEYIDERIAYWREQEGRQVINYTKFKEFDHTKLRENMCKCYIDAYQSIRNSLFGNLKQ